MQRQPAGWWWLTMLFTMPAHDTDASDAFRAHTNALPTTSALAPVATLEGNTACPSTCARLVIAPSSQHHAAPLVMTAHIIVEPPASDATFVARAVKGATVVPLSAAWLGSSGTGISLPWHLAAVASRCRGISLPWHLAAVAPQTLEGHRGARRQRHTIGHVLDVAEDVCAAQCGRCSSLQTDARR